MRTDTDEFKCQQDTSMDKLVACIDENDIVVSFSNDGLPGCGTVFMTKQQAAKFARQILEMVGEGENES